MNDDEEVAARIANNIRERRAALKITQSELSAALGVSFQQVQKYLVGKNRVPSVRMPALAKVLKCSVGELYGVRDASAPGADRLLSAWRDLPIKQREAVVDLVEALERAARSD